MTGLVTEMMAHMLAENELLVIGAVHWDILGKVTSPFALGDDLPGNVQRRVGGVAATVALAIARSKVPVSLMAATGDDIEGEDLIRHVEKAGVNTEWMILQSSMVTDRYIAIEDNESLVAAVADCNCLERSESVMFESAKTWLQKQSTINCRPTMIVDGNMSADFLDRLGNSHAASSARIVYVAASKKKVCGLQTVSCRHRFSLYLNRFEAEHLMDTSLTDSYRAAQALMAAGYRCFVITDGQRAAADGHDDSIVTVKPRTCIMPLQTGAGDRFAAVHLIARRRGFERHQSLMMAHQAAMIGEEAHT
ncbi:MAG: PfkB family carbohydrate kinase [Rhodobacteraceae bacterium]|nr:PfkB family carbohydrate kinase [Paracoccaceae bacterium]MCY4325990.1 PfkB family carbohydrate kinase [Paracoccaceae bacterium]